MLKLPPSKVVDVVRALAAHEFDRDAFRVAVLRLFNAKTEKSVFRGMAIPTLRVLGLLVGFEREMHLSGDGTLVREVDTDSPGPNVAMQRILCLLEGQHGLEPPWMSGALRYDLAFKAFGALEPQTAGDFTGHLRRWLLYLTYFGIIERRDDRLIRIIRLTPVQKWTKKALLELSTGLRLAYHQIAPRGVGEPIAAIEDVHRTFAVAQWQARKALITRSDFDALLTLIIEKHPLSIHLHRSMGPEQRLFVYRGEHYQALSIAESRR